MKKSWEEHALCQLLGIKYPIIMAPMFLVSNEAMLLAATKSGIAAAIPALNYRTSDLLKEGLLNLKKQATGPIGVNLIVNKSNVQLERQLAVCMEVGVDFIITSLGSPRDVIEQSKKQNIPVFCDVIDLKFALKVAELGASGVIAVNNRAGGHLGPTSPEKLITELKEHLSIPVISAGGVGTYVDLEDLSDVGADGFSIGSIFIASDESPVSDAYKQACVDYGAKDIVLTTKLSGTPCTVINTPYLQEIGTEQSAFQRWLQKNKWLKKWLKMIVYMRGMNGLRKAAFGATYKTIWCAGTTIENVTAIRSVSEIVDSLVTESN